MSVCAAVDCKNNYFQGFRMHKFPADLQRRLQWAYNCGRRGWIPSRNDVLCNIHFDDSQYEMNRADGRKLLKFNATPTLFKNTSSSSSEEEEEEDETQVEHEVPVVPKINTSFLLSFTKEQTRKKLKLEDSNDPSTINTNTVDASKNDLPPAPEDSIGKFQDFLANFHSRLKLCEWKIKILKDSLYLYTLDTNTSECTLFIRSHICIMQDMSVKVFQNNRQLTKSDLYWVFPKKLELERWSQMEKLLIRYCVDTLDGGDDNLLDNENTKETGHKNERDTKIFCVIKLENDD